MLLRVLFLSKFLLHGEKALLIKQLFLFSSSAIPETASDIKHFESRPLFFTSSFTFNSCFSHMFNR